MSDSTNNTLLNIAFNRWANATVMGIIGITAWSLLPFSFFMIAMIALVVFFVVGVTPSAKRNRTSWNAFFPRQVPDRVKSVEGAHWREWKLPLLIVVHSEKKFGLESLPFWNHEAFDNASICAQLSSRSYPLARYVLWKLGGILPASRSVLLRLLGRRSVEGGSSSASAGPAASSSSGGAAAAAAAASSGGTPTRTSGGESTVGPASMVVAFYDGTTLKVGGGSGAGAGGAVSAELTTKQVISAALKTGVQVAAAVQMPDGTIWVGKPQQLSANASSGGAIETPELEQVLAASEEYCGALKSVLRKAYPSASEVKVSR